MRPDILSLPTTQYLGSLHGCGWEGRLSGRIPFGLFGGPPCGVQTQCLPPVTLAVGRNRGAEIRISTESRALSAARTPRDRRQRTRVGAGPVLRRWWCVTRARRSAVARPIPRLAPVTMATDLVVMKLSPPDIDSSAEQSLLSRESFAGSLQDHVDRQIILSPRFLRFGCPCHLRRGSLSSRRQFPPRGSRLRNGQCPGIGPSHLVCLCERLPPPRE